MAKKPRDVVNVAKLNLHVGPVPRAPGSMLKKPKGVKDGRR